MNKIMTDGKPSRILLPSTACMGILLLLGLLFWVPAATADSPPKPRHVLSEDGQPVEVLPVAAMTIAKKTEKHVFTNGGDSYALSQGTMIVGMDGRQVRLKQMPVPCDVNMTYKVVQGMRYAFRIQITQVGNNPTAEMIYEVPH